MIQDGKDTLDLIMADSFGKKVLASADLDMASMTELLELSICWVSGIFWTNLTVKRSKRQPPDMGGLLNMKIIISPTKKMKREEFISPNAKPLFLDKTKEILDYLNSLTREEKARVWKVKGKLLEENLERLGEIDLSVSGSPALFSYDGIQFTYMSPSSFTDDMLSYCEDKLRIISGFYGLLRPLDGIVPYRLEMESKINIFGKGNLYKYWGCDIASELEKDESIILNLASEEYSKAVIPYLNEGIEVITPVFLEEEDGLVVTKGVYAKMARGEMVRFLSQNNITDIEGIKEFSISGYHYSPSLSTNEKMAFVRKE